MKQFRITILLTVLMSMFGAKAFAHDIEVANNDGITIYYKWINDKTELAVTYRGLSYHNYSDRYFGDVVIPESVDYEGNTYYVTSIGEAAFSGCSGLTSVTIPNSVTSIGEAAFRGCGGLTSVIIPNSVTSFGAEVFRNCIGLTSVIIPNSVTSISYSAFDGCSSLTSVTIGNSVTSVGELAFNGCSELTSVTIPNSVTSIGIRAFSGCSGLMSVVIGSGVTTIDYNAFEKTKIIKIIWLTNTPPDGLSYAQGTVNYVANEEYNINNKVVYPFLSSYFDVDGVRYVPVSLSDKTCDAIDCIYDESAENIQIAPTVIYKGISMSVNKLQPYIGYGNKYIKNLTISTEGDLGDYTFANCSSLETANISITGSIWNYSFSKCSKLKNLTLGSSVSEIGSHTFQECSSLESIIIPNLIEFIGEYSFVNCSALKTVEIGSNVKVIEQDAFNGCEALLSITIPQSVTDIQRYVFYNCKSLKEVIIADSEVELNLGSNGKNPTFSSCPLDTVYIGRNINYKTDQDAGYSPFYRNTSLRAVKITDKETEISENEFYGCTNLQRVIIGDGVKNIGNWAFSGCSSLKFFTFGSEVKTIGQEAFSDCSAVTEITSRANIPPTCGAQALDDINKWECKLIVPQTMMDAYKVADQWKEFLFVEEGDAPIIKTDVEITIGSSGKTTYCCDYALDFSSFEDLKAYVATGYESDGTIWLTRIKQVPANTPILVKGEASKSYEVPIIDKCVAHFENMFQGNATENLIINTTTEDGKYKNFYMSGGQFKPASASQKISAGKAYLQVPAKFKAANAGADQTVKIAESGKSSYAPPVDVDLTDVDGLKAYASAGYDAASSTIWLTRINKIQAGEGVLLKGEVGKEYTLPSVAVQAYYGNMFVGNIGSKITINETSYDGEWTNYYLASGSFKKVSGTREIGTNKSYLHLPTSLLVSSARGKQNADIDEWFMEELETEAMLLGSIGGDDDGSTRIDAIRQNNAQPDVYYNLQGQRIDNPKKGIYIHKGRKVVIK